MEKYTAQNRSMNVLPRPFPRNERLRLCVKFAALAILLTSCSPTEDAEEEKPEPQGRTELVGRIASISLEKSFVLIQSYGDWEVADGSILIARGADERTANLRATGEKLGQFAAADIQSGDVAVGDAVMLLPAPPPQPDPERADAENSATDEAEAP